MTETKLKIVPIRSRLISRFAMEIVCQAYGVTPAEFAKETRASERVTNARQVAAYIAHTIGGVPFAEMSDTFYRRRSTLSHGCVVVEEKRESPIFDREVEILEQRFNDRLAEYETSGLMRRAFDAEERAREEARIAATIGKRAWAAVKAREAVRREYQRLKKLREE